MVDSRPPYGHAVAASAAVLLLYAVTLAPTAWFWDSGEYIAAAATLGIPHPPGNPFFVLLGKVWITLLSPTGLPVAVRMNLLAAASSAAATGILFLLAHRVLAGCMRSGVGGGSGERTAALVPVAGAWAGALLAATAFTVWNQSNLNEKVYTLSVLAIALVSWLAILWVDRKDRAGSEWLLVLAVYVMALGSTNHLMSVLPAPALVFLVLREKPGLFLHRGMWVQAAAAVTLGLSLSLFLPIRSVHDPLINEGEPTCESVGDAAAAVFSLGRVGCPALAANLTREQYGKPSILVDPTTAPFDPQPRSSCPPRTPVPQLFPVLRLAVGAGARLLRAARHRKDPHLPRPSRPRDLGARCERPVAPGPRALSRHPRAHPLGRARLLPELPLRLFARA